MSRLVLVSVVLAAAPVFAQPAEPPPGEPAGEEPSEQTEEPEKPPAETRPAPEIPDVDALRRRYFELRDKLFRSRARAASVATALYSTRIQIKLDYRSARHYAVTRAIIRVDGATVFDDSEGAVAADTAPRFEGYIAPGRHQVTLRIEATGKDDSRITTATETTLSVIAPPGRDLIIDARAADRGDMAYRWQRDSRGNYRLRLDVDVKSVEHDRPVKKGLIKRG